MALAIHSGDLAVLGEFSGIREYLLKPLPGAGSARRLRARSFRVRTFTHLIARAIRRRCGLAPDGALESLAGDRLLLAGRAEDGAERAVTAYQAELDRWSLAELGGELVFHLAAARCGTEGIPRAALEGKLTHRKLRPLEGALVAGARWNNAAFRSAWGDPHAQVCAGCGATAGDVSNGSLCDSCVDDDELGKLLPACNFGHWVEQDHSTIHVPGQGLALSTADRTMAGSGDLDLTTSDWTILRHLPHGDFEGLAERSPGRGKLLAYLAISVDASAPGDRADVESNPSAHPVAEESQGEATPEAAIPGPEVIAPSDINALDSAPLPAAAANPPPDSVAAHAHSLIVAGFPDVYPIQGDHDTLLATGPWDQVLRLALQLRHDFRPTVRNNGQPVAVFAGMSLEHPRANLRSAVDHVRGELTRAQSGETQGGRISVFGEILPWKTAKEVADRGFEMAGWLKEDRMSSSALRRIGELHRSSQGTRGAPGADHWKFRYLPLLIWQARDADRLLRRKILRLAADLELWENTGLVTELAFLAAPMRAKGNPARSNASALDSPVKAGGERDG